VETQQVALQLVRDFVYKRHRRLLGDGVFFLHFLESAKQALLFQGALCYNDSE
jgi:hypothetical protein